MGGMLWGSSGVEARAQNAAAKVLKAEKLDQGDYETLALAIENNAPCITEKVIEILAKDSDFLIELKRFPGRWGSAIEKLKSAATRSPGGIDFRSLPITIQPAVVGQQPTVGSPQMLNKGINLVQEWSQIQNMVNAGIIPSSQRLREYLEASCKSGDASVEIDKMLSCIADILRIEEERCSATDPALREFLDLLESSNSAQELGSKLNKIGVSGKEPRSTPLS